MTIKEFNEKYKDYLEEGHYGLDIGEPEVIEYLDNIFKDLIKIPGFQYSQIKLKFGSCRFYTNLESNLDYLIEDKIEKILKNIDETIKKDQEENKKI